MIKNSIYYQEKLSKLFDKLFLNVGDARERFIKCEEQFTSAYLASRYDGVPPYVQEYWQKMWADLHKIDSSVTQEGKENNLSFHQTFKSIENESLEDYLFFIFEEEGRLSDLHLEINYTRKNL